VRRVVALAVAAVWLAACGPGGVTSTPGTPGASASAASLAPETCPITTPPGPDDQPPDGSDSGDGAQGGGRAAACLIGPPAVSWEDTAWCTWTPDRLAVEAVTGLPATAEGAEGTWDAYLDLRASEIQISQTAPDGTVITWSQPDVTAVIRDDGSDGLATFDAALAPGSASPPPATPPRVAGVLRWQCAGPPPA
jgi:hypothetical protein